MGKNQEIKMDNGTHPNFPNEKYNGKEICDFTHGGP
jgi:hypothetical protein